MKRMLIYVWAEHGLGCFVLRESADFDVHAWFESRRAAFALLRISRVEWELVGCT